MSHWRKVLPGRVIDIQYEDIVYNTEKKMRWLITDILKLKWEPEVLEFHRSQRSVLTNSMSQVRHKISDKAIGGWRRYKNQLRKTIDLLTPEINLLSAMGGLPFRSSINWNISVDFDYCSVLDCSDFRSANSLSEPSKLQDVGVSSI
jgi:hypothetical protein